MAIVEIFKFPTPVSDSVTQTVLLHKAPSEVDVFGRQCRVETSATMPAGQTFDSMVDLGQQSYDWGLSLVIFMTIAILYYVGMRFFGELTTALKNSVSLEKSIGLLNNRSVDYMRLIRYSILLMAVGWVTMAYYYLDYVGASVAHDLGWWGFPWWGVYFSTFGVFLGIWTYQAVLTFACKWVGGEGSFYSVLGYVGQFTAVMFSFVAFPVMIFMMLLGLHPWWPFAVVLLLYMFHFARVSKHFIINGFAPLQCFLYLCTVEILPFGVIWLLNR